MSSANFDGVAAIYDTLSNVVFGRSMVRSQTFYLRDIPSGAKVLIIGGGTGWLLKELLVVNSTCSIWYIEASAKMLELTKERISKSSNAIHLIHGTEDSIPPGIKFDAVITHFYLDLFSQISCNQVIQKISRSMHVKSMWLVTDFINKTWWQNILLFVMYKFFRLTSHIEASNLPAWQQLLKTNGFIEDKSNFFFWKFIRSSLFVSG